MVLRGVGCNRLTISSALRIGPSTMYLEVWVRLLAVQYGTGSLGYIWLGYRLAALIRMEVHLRLRRVEIRLTLLEMFNLPCRVLRSYKPAVLASHLVTFRRCIGVLELHEGTANVRIRMSAHCDRH